MDKLCLSCLLDIQVEMLRQLDIQIKFLGKSGMKGRDLGIISTQMISKTMRVNGVTKGKHTVIEENKAQDKSLLPSNL